MVSKFQTVTRVSRLLRCRADAKSDTVGRIYCDCVLVFWLWLPTHEVLSGQVSAEAELGQHPCGCLSCLSSKCSKLIGPDKALFAQLIEPGQHRVDRDV